MPVDGSAQLRALAVNLRASGNLALLAEMRSGIRTAAAPLVGDVKAAATRQLPKAGGLNMQVAGQRVTVSVRTGARTAGVRMATTAPDTKQTDSGFVRHPKWGRRGKGQWSTQQIPAAKGWWSDTLNGRSRVRVTAGILGVMRVVRAQIERGV